MFQEMLNLEEISKFVMPKNIFLMQNKIFISFPTKIKIKNIWPF